MVLTVFLPDRISPGNLRRGVSVRCWSNLILMGKEVLVSLFVRFLYLLHCVLSHPLYSYYALKRR